MKECSNNRGYIEANEEWLISKFEKEKQELVRKFESELKISRAKTLAAMQNQWNQQWKKSSKIISKIIKSKILSQEEAEALVSAIFARYKSSFFFRDFRIGDSFEDCLFELIQKTYPKKIEKSDLIPKIKRELITLENKHGRAIIIDMLLEEMKKKGYKKSDVSKAVKSLIREGYLISPKKGIVQIK